MLPRDPQPNAWVAASVPPNVCVFLSGLVLLGVFGLACCIEIRSIGDVQYTREFTEIILTRFQ